MQYALRPYATAGVALVGASIIAVTPVAVPLPTVQARAVHLVDAWSDLFSETATNLANISANADPTATAGVLQALLTNPLGVIQAFTNLTPTIDASVGTLPATVNIDLPPGLEVLLAQIGAEGAAFNAVNDVVAQLATNPSGALNTLFEAPAVIANAYLNGQDNISLFGGLINVAGFNGILAPLQDVSFNLNLTSLLDALGIGDISLSSLGINLTDLLNQLGLGTLDLGGLFNALGLSNEGLGTLLGDPTLASLLTTLNLGGLPLGDFGLSDVLNTLGLNVPLNNLSLDTVLNLFGINGNIDMGLAGFLTQLGFGNFVNEGLGSVVSALPGGLLTDILNPLNSALATLLNPLLTSTLLQPLLPIIEQQFGLDFNSLLTPESLVTALNQVTIGDLLGGQTINESVSSLLGALGVDVPGNLTIGGILDGLGVPDTITGLDLGDLLSGFGLGALPVGDLLDTVNLGTLLGDLGLSDLPLNLANLPDLADLTVGGLLGSLGLGDIASINIDGFGGLSTLLTDTIPQQILAALGG